MYWKCLWTATTSESVVHAQIIYEHEESRGNDTDRWKPKNSERNLFQCHSVHQTVYPIWNDPAWTRASAVRGRIMTLTIHRHLRPWSRNEWVPAWRVRIALLLFTFVTKNVHYISIRKISWLISFRYTIWSRFGELKMQLWDSMCWPHVNPAPSGAVGIDCQRRLLSRPKVRQSL
jgi:hypothetical protein